VEEKAGQLAVSSNYKTEFIANMSHELRTPLNSLLILAQQLSENIGGGMSDTQVQYANVILDSGQDLLALLNGILDLAKVESGTVTIDMDDVGLVGLRDSLLREYQPMASAKGLNYSIDLSSDAPASVVTDPQRLRQVLKNLLTNAFKFTEQGEVRVHIGEATGGWSRATTSLVEAPGVIAFSVSDTGIGIDPEHQERIFEPFSQVDGSTARIYGGTGLGLSISRDLVTLLGGEITISSALDRGTTFSVYLPLRSPPGVEEAISTSVPDPHPGSPPQANWRLEANARLLEQTGVDSTPLDAEPVDAAGLAGIKVLVVDDDMRNIFAMTALLDRCGADVTTAESGADAIAALTEDPDMDIVLMDIMMPVMDGYMTVAAIRSIDRFKALPVIAITGKESEGERERCLAAGASDYLPKPVNAKELFLGIRSWLPKAAPGR
jgi:CheY-like chemotaxis protein/nitrogen-specific signal transduction histidine kinase